MVHRIYSVHFYYHKRSSRKAASKFEGIVFTKSQDHAEELVKKLISDYPIEAEEPFSIIGDSDKTLEQIYKERPELIGITPEQGYIYNEFMHRNSISRYVAKSNRGFIMCRCIYCNSDDLSVSDIISYALTGAKVTKKFVCHEHNAFTNENFERFAIANLNFFRNSLGLSERSGKDIKYRANLIIDGITIPNVAVSGRTSIYEDKKRLFSAEHDGKKVLIGNVDKLKQKKGVCAGNIDTLDMSDTVVSVTFSIEQLFASDEMLRTIAKIAYEWYCYSNKINNFIPEIYQDIVDCVLMKRPVTEFVEIVVDGNLDYALKDICYLGSHGLFEYVDIDGYKYVILNFWGIIYYKIRICNLNSPNFNLANYYNLFLYAIDGEKSQTCFGTMGKSNFISMPAKQAIQQFHKVYVSKLEQFVKTTVLSLAKMKELIDELRKAITIYKQPPYDFAHLVEYESNERVMTIHVLLFLLEHEKNYLFSSSFNENLKSFYKIDDTLTVTVEENEEYLKYLLELHESSTLLDSIVS